MSTDPLRIAHDGRDSSLVPAARLSAFMGSREAAFLKRDVEDAEQAASRDLMKPGTAERIQRMVMEYHLKK
jgi:hypothetical protein